MNPSALQEGDVQENTSIEDALQHLLRYPVTVPTRANTGGTEAAPTCTIHVGDHSKVAVGYHG